MLTPKENYLRMLGGEIPEYMPAYADPFQMPVKDELLTPQAAPNGPIVTSLGVTYVGNEENNFGAMPEPGKIIIDDITKWRDQLKIRDVSDWDWEGYYKRLLADIDREKMCVNVGGGDYFLTLVSLMGFEGALLAMHEEPEEVIELLTHISKFYILVQKQQMHYIKPDIYGLMDDDAAYRSPFFSLEMYREIFKPFHKLHCDIALESGCYIDRHDCGRSEQFIEDWLEMGVRTWNPVQVSNDCRGIKQKYGGRLALAGCWDTQHWSSVKEFDEKELTDTLIEYVDTFAPGGNFTYTAGMGLQGASMDSLTKKKHDIATKVYNDYARNWYKTH